MQSQFQQLVSQIFVPLICTRLSTENVLSVEPSAVVLIERWKEWAPLNITTAFYKGQNIGTQIPIIVFDWVG